MSTRLQVARQTDVRPADTFPPVGLGRSLERSLQPFGHHRGVCPSSDLADRTRAEGSLADAGMLADQAAAGPAPAPAAPAAPTATPVSVDRIDVVDSPAGAIGGYPAVTTGDLNVPGPFNNAAAGGVSNVHQIHFSLDQGTSAMLTPRRELQRSAWVAGVESRNPPDRPLSPGMHGPPTPGGFHGVIVGPDGPGAHEVQRPTSDKIVVADAPGAASLTAAQHPFVYRSRFSVTVVDGAGFDVARIRYEVHIDKRSAADVPNTENRIFAVGKEDMVRNVSLP
jgi:hypothetical protein